MVAPAQESKQRYWYVSYADVNVGVVYVAVVPPVPSDTSDHVAVSYTHLTLPTNREV